LRAVGVGSKVAIHGLISKSEDTIFNLLKVCIFSHKCAFQIGLILQNGDEERKLIWSNQQQHGLYLLAKRVWMKQKAQELEMEDLKQKLLHYEQRMQAMEQKLEMQHEDAISVQHEDAICVQLQFDELVLVFTNLNTTQNRRKDAKKVDTMLGLQERMVSCNRRVSRNGC